MDIVFKRSDPDMPDMFFVEVEDGHGQGIQVGEWIERPDGFTVLRLPETAESLMPAIAQWQDATFGKDQPVQGLVNHLVREVAELVQDPADGEEQADVFILLVGLAARTNRDLVAEAVQKMGINRKRKWKTADHEGVIEHVHTEETAG